jgi:hypothetical protein
MLVFACSGIFRSCHGIVTTINGASLESPVWNIPSLKQPKP